MEHRSMVYVDRFFRIVPALYCVRMYMRACCWSVIVVFFYYGGGTEEAGLLIIGKFYHVVCLSLPHALSWCGLH